MLSTVRQQRIGYAALVSDEEIIARVLSGSAQAYGELVARHQGNAYWLAYRMTGSREEAEDAAQEAFVKAYVKLDAYRGTGSFWPWLRRILLNTCLSKASRKGAKEPMVELTEADCDSDYSLETEILNRAEAEEVRKAIAELPATYRAAVVLRYREGLSYKETAEQLGESLSNVRVRLYRAKRLLAVRLRGLSDELP